MTHYTKPEDVLKDMVAACPNSSAALLARSRYLREVGLFPDAIRDVEAASKIAPDEVEVLLASTDLKLETGDLEGARRDLEKGLASHPQEMRLLLEMAAVEMRQAHPSQALDRLQAARACSERNPPAATTYGTWPRCTSTPGSPTRRGTCWRS